MLNFRWCSVGDNESEIKDKNSIAHVHHQTHIVLDKQNAKPVGGKFAKQNTESIAFGFIKTRSWFIKKEQSRTGCKSTSNFNETCGASREIAGGLFS
jgi:hypothetical protein